MSALLARLLTALASHVVPESIDRLWLFPPRQLRGEESGLVVLALYTAPSVDTRFRRLVTLRYRSAPGAELPIHEELVEQGVAPAELIDRVVAGVLRRLGDKPEAPEVVRIEGDPACWERMLAGMNDPRSAA